MYTDRFGVLDRRFQFFISVGLFLCHLFSLLFFRFCRRTRCAAFRPAVCLFFRCGIWCIRRTGYRSQHLNFIPPPFPEKTSVDGGSATLHFRHNFIQPHQRTGNNLSVLIDRADIRVRQRLYNPPFLVHHPFCSPDLFKHEHIAGNDQLFNLLSLCFFSWRRTVRRQEAVGIDLRHPALTARICLYRKHAFYLFYCFLTILIVNSMKSLTDNRIYNSPQKGKILFFFSPGFPSLKSICSTPRIFSAASSFAITSAVPSEYLQRLFHTSGIRSKYSRRHIIVHIIQQRHHKLSTGFLYN